MLHHASALAGLLRPRAQPETKSRGRSGNGADAGPGRDVLKAVSQLQRESEAALALEAESAQINQQLALQVAALQRCAGAGKPQSRAEREREDPCSFAEAWQSPACTQGLRFFGVRCPRGAGSCAGRIAAVA